MFLLKGRISRRRFSVLSFAAILATALPSSLAHSGEVYVFGGAGFNLMDDPEYDLTSNNNPTVDLNVDNGFGISGGVGYRWEDFMFEYEFLYTYNSLDSQTVNGATATINDGSFSSLRNYINVLYEVPLDFPVRPYFGGGVGVGAVNFDLGTSDATESGFAYQGKAGIGVELVDGLDLTAQYRYSGVENIEYVTNLGTGELDNRNHIFEVGLRYFFGGNESRRQSARGDRGEPRDVASADNGVMLADSQATDGSPRWSNPVQEAKATAPETTTLAPLPAGNAASPTPVANSTFSPDEIGYGVQMGAFKTHDAALKAWPRVERRHASLVGNSFPVVRSARVPGKGLMHRLFAGGYGKADADAICRRLKASGQWCQVRAL
ncbi:MAG: outer membrane beta-barrel protein [Pseudomonadota bacterium]